jgi:hypothetical protein
VPHVLIAFGDVIVAKSCLKNLVRRLMKTATIVFVSSATWTGTNPSPLGASIAELPS